MERLLWAGVGAAAALTSTWVLRRLGLTGSGAGAPARVLEPAAREDAAAARTSTRSSSSSALEAADFAGRTVLVTGASSGIGRSIAERFASLGARVLVHGHSSRRGADETVAACRAARRGWLAKQAKASEESRSEECTKTEEVEEDDGVSESTFDVVLADISDVDACRALVERAVAWAGPAGLDVLVNNAGVFEEVDPRSCSFDEWRASWTRTMRVNLESAANLTFLVSQHQRARGTGGAIVNVSSRGAFRGEPRAVAYGASKAGMNAMAQSFAQALGPDGIRVSVVAPGFVETPMAASVLDGPQGPSVRAQSSWGRVARPEEVAEAVVFLAGERVSFLTGAILDVNGASYLRS